MRRILGVAFAILALGAIALMPAVASADRNHGRHGGDVRLTGTIVSFTGGVLTVRKADGTSVSARVTRRTEIECEGPRERASQSRHGRGKHCGTAALQPGVVVIRGRIRDRGAGPFWKQLKLAA